MTKELIDNESIDNENAKDVTCVDAEPEMSLKCPDPQELNSLDGFNPQEASSDKYSDGVRLESPRVSERPREEINTLAKSSKSKETSSQPNSKQKKIALNRRKRRATRQVAVEDNCLMGIGLLLPLNQFETIICRRTIHKRDVSVNIGESSYSYKQNPQKKQISSSEINLSTAFSYLHEDDPIDNEPGDISLGMKLSVVGGKVIVQHLKPLVDGKASPAQLTGVISRGDVLLAINEKNLVNLTLDQLMSALSPLSSPDPSGSYRRKLKLRFAAKHGLEELRTIEESLPLETQKSDLGLDIARDMFALFPMVEQLEDLPIIKERVDTEKKTIVSLSNLSSNELLNSQKDNRIISRSISSNSQDDFIAKNLSSLRIRERDQFLHEFNSWNKNFIDSLEIAGSSVDDQENDASESVSSQPAELTDIGRDALAGLNVLSRKLEDVDCGKKEDNPMISWNTTLSLFSRASRRGKRFFDGASLPSRFSRIVEPTKENESYENDSNVSLSEVAEEDMLGGDELLVHLASHDELWRKQLIDVLLQMTQINEEEVNSDVDNVKEDIVDLDETISNGLGNLLFGEDMTKILKSPGKLRSLPCDEATSLLYDLATKVSSIIPQEIAAPKNGTLETVNAFNRKEGLAKDKDVQVATSFLIIEAIPVWLKSFTPLPWEHRRVLWPLGAQRNFGGSTAASSMSDDITLESIGTGRQTTPNRKDIVSIIEERELNSDTRNETCFLVTYYFMHLLLPKLENAESSRDVEFKADLDSIIVYLGEFGAYLEINKCLIQAAIMCADVVIDLLLGIAKHDPRHREVMKLMSKPNQLVFYEQSMLSAVLQRLYNINKERSSAVKTKLVEVCSAAYPDIQPWQVKKMCYVNEASIEESVAMTDRYYQYLSLLLNPSDGFEAARRQPPLVTEWCELSIDRIAKSKNKGKFFQNFVSVATRRSNNAIFYARDLFRLLELSMELEEHNISLDLIEEILEQNSLSSPTDAVNVTMGCLRSIGKKAIELDEESASVAEQILRRVLGLFTNDIIRRYADVPSALLHFLEQIMRYGCIGSYRQQLKTLSDIIAEEGVPSDVLRSVALSSDPSLCENVFDLLQKVLRKAARISMNTDLSKSRMLLKTARQQVERSLQLTSAVYNNDSKAQETSSIWESMSRGSLSIDK